jgi:hypothetical protein
MYYYLLYLLFATEITHLIIHLIRDLDLIRFNTILKLN